MKEGWDYRAFERCLKKVPKQKAVKSKDYLEEGKFPIVSQESYLISGYTNDEALLYKHERPVVIFGDHTKNVKYVPFDFVVGADGVHILFTQDDILPKFFYYELCSIKLRDLGYARHYKLLREKTIGIPSIPEQERIVALLDKQFERIDMLKRNAEHQLQAAKDLYERFIEQIFSDNNKWSETSIGECFVSINNGANIKQTKGASGIPITRIETLANGVFNPNRLGYANIEDASKYEKYIMKDGDLLMSHINSVEFTGRTVAYHNQLPVVIHGMNLLRLVPKDNINSDFFVYLTKSKGFKESIRSITHKSVNQASFNTTALKAINIILPKIEEQQSIVTKLDTLSERVKALQANYTETITLCNDLKQSLLKSIFA